jgi:hypothetical protein
MHRHIVRQKKAKGYMVWLVQETPPRLLKQNHPCIKPRFVVEITDGRGGRIRNPRKDAEDALDAFCTTWALIVTEKIVPHYTAFQRQG